jgi:predicted dehydrogenase
VKLKQEPYRIGIVGAGNISRLHLDGMKEHPDRARCVALCDPSAEALQARMKEYGVSSGFSDVEAFARDAGVGAAIVCTPTHLRQSILEPLIEAGIPVLCEKPLAETYEEAKALAALAARHRVPVAVNQNFRRHFTFALGREVLASRALGKPLHLVQAAMGLRRDAGWRLDRRRYAMSVMSIHWFDGYRFLLDDEPESVYVRGLNSPAIPGGDDTAVSMVIAFRKGAVVSLSESFSSHTGNFEGTLTCDCERGGLIMGYNALIRITADGRREEVANPMNKAQATYHVLDDLLRAVEEQRAPETSTKDNLKSMRLLEAAYRSFEQARVVKCEEVR